MLVPSTLRIILYSLPQLEKSLLRAGGLLR